MSVKNRVRIIFLSRIIKNLVWAAPFLVKFSPMRHSMIRIGGRIARFTQKRKNFDFLQQPGVIADRSDFRRAILHSLDRTLSYISPAALQGLLNSLLSNYVSEDVDRKAIDRFYAQNGTYPPNFLTISPGKACNLQCVGCYANSEEDGEKLEWATFDRIIAEAKAMWGIRFFVISGGEPLAYRSEGKTILDIAEKHSDCIFMMYTNGTLITDEMAQRLAILGNLSPVFSVEGWQEATDKRRGQGIYEKVLEAMKQLRQTGVIFGLSLTGTRHNTEEILSDKFIDFFFKEQGVLYGWLFQYMPIGRSYTLDLMPTTQQRNTMRERSWEIIREKQIFLADFWNHATISNGCLAAGRTRGGGYLYIDWNGAVSPCVFVPYSPVNIKNVYADGGTLNDVLKEPFFAGIRDWQEDYHQNDGNWLAPCIIRDHHSELRKLIAENEPDPTDENACKALLDSEYAEGLKDYGKQYQLLTEQVWKDQYLRENESSKNSDKILVGDKCME